MSQNPQKNYVYSDVNGAGVVRRKVAIIGAGPVSVWFYLQRQFDKNFG